MFFKDQILRFFCSLVYSLVYTGGFKRTGSLLALRIFFYVNKNLVQINRFSSYGPNGKGSKMFSFLLFSPGDL